MLEPIHCLQHQAGDFDIPSYGHQDVDRFGVLMDAWTHEAAFLECKRELIDCYYEAYQHVCDRDERRRLAQVVTDIMHQRPRLDLDSDYLVKLYRAECSVLRQHTRLVKAVLDRQVEQQREFIQRVTREGDMEIGLPHRIVPKQLIAVNLSRPALKNVYMLEFHPTLAIASRIPAALQHAYWELHQIHQPDSALNAIAMERKLLEVALREWESLPAAGDSFSMQVQKDLFSDVFADDPLFQCELALFSIRLQDEKAGRRTHKEKQVDMVASVGRLMGLFSDVFADDPLFQCELALFSIRLQDEKAGRRTHKEKQVDMVASVGRLMGILTYRHRLIEACWETEILSKIYKKQAGEMGYPDFHLNMRFVQFEFASFKEKAGKPPPIFITAVQEDDTAVDKYTPSCLYLAIHELDEGHVGRFSFRSRDGVLQLMRLGGMESLQVVLKSQIVHKNALIAGVTQATVCDPVKAAHTGPKSGRASPTETKSEKSSLTQMTGMSGGTGGTALAGKLTSDGGKVKKAAEAFFSLQLEKTPSRDLMLNDFVAKKQQSGSLMRNSEELEKVKRTLISQFCERFHVRLSQASMRGQLLAYYNSIFNLLEGFPSVRETYFVMGEVNEKKSQEDDLEGLTPDPRVMKKRPRRLLSKDGRHVLNIWFIPHYTEILVMFKHLDDESCSRAMAFALSIVATLHDMLQYLSAHARLGSSHARMGSQTMEFVSADWGGTEGIGSELREIQKQIIHLHDPTDPQSVLDLLTLRRDVMFLEYDMAVRSSMADTFLATGNIQAYKSIVSNGHAALSAISNIQRPSLTAAYLTIPEPLEAKDLVARQLFPWRAFLN
ncbi:coiled-coil domain-containing protein 162-like, partial [Elysia marginata]